MSAERVLADAVLAAVAEALGDRVNGVVEGAAVKASAPWVELGPIVAADWSTKDKAGREVRLVLTVRDRADRPARCHALAADAGGAVEGVARDLPVEDPAWRIASLAFVRARVTGARPGEWAATVEYQVRLLAA